MSTEKELRLKLQELSNEGFRRAYLDTKEVGWAAMSRGELHTWMAEVHRRGMAQELEDDNGEIRLAPTRHLVSRGMAESSADTPTGTPWPLGPMESGALSLGPEIAGPAERANAIGQPSTGESFGAQNGAGSGYEIVAYRRLPLAAKRDAFVADGFMYVRNDVFDRWLTRTSLGRCCPAQREGEKHHSSGCWFNAVR